MASTRGQLTNGLLVGYSFNEVSGPWSPTTSAGDGTVLNGKNGCTNSAAGLGVSGISSDRCMDSSSGTVQGGSANNLGAQSGNKDTNLDNLTAFTLCGWYKANTGLPIVSANRLLSCLQSSAGGFEVQGNPNGPGISLQMWGGGAAQRSATNAIFSETGAWVFWAVTWSAASGTVNFYAGDSATPVNAFGSAAFTAKSNTGVSTNLTVGNLLALNRGFAGYMDDVAIYSNVLNVVQLEDIRKASVAVPVSLTVDSSTNPSVAGGPVYFIASITPTNVTGAVTFWANGQPFSTNAVANGTSTSAALNTLPVGTNLVAAVYSGDANDVGASNFLNQIVMATNYLWVDVDNYGAVGDGVTLNTVAIQSAISACPPGGFVWLHNGTFLTGTIYLTNNLTLYIDSTATLLGSLSPADYPLLATSVSDGAVPTNPEALIFASGNTNITITGGGTINGNGQDFYPFNGSSTNRPFPILTSQCNGITIDNICVTNPAYWSVVNVQADYLTISNVTVNSRAMGFEHDGCDVVDCWHGVVEDCRINSGDDAICLKSGVQRGVNDLLVTNCTVAFSQANGLKFGTASTGGFTNITIQNCTIQAAGFSAMAVESVDGGGIANVTFQGINFSNCQNAFFVILGTRRPNAGAAGSINGITFRDITGSHLTDRRGCPIFGETTNGVTYKLKNIVFDNVNVSFAGGVATNPSPPPEYCGQYPENNIWSNLPAYGFYVMHANGVTFSNCFFSTSTPEVRPWIGTNDVANLAITPKLVIQPGTNGPLLLWNNGFTPSTLQVTTNLLQSFSDLTGATNPYVYKNFAGAPVGFFRLRQ